MSEHKSGREETNLYKYVCLDEVNYMLIDRREHKNVIDLRSKFNSVTNLKRKLTFKKNKSQESDMVKEHGLTGRKMRTKEDLTKLLAKNSSTNATPFSIKNVKMFTGYPAFYVK